MDGIVTIVQESRFQMVDTDGVAHLFILGHKAAAEPHSLGRCSGGRHACGCVTSQRRT